MNSRYSRIFLIFWCLCFSLPGLMAQLQMKLQLMPDGSSYGVYVKISPGYNPSANTITASGQVTIVMPLDFQWNNLVSHHGWWVANAAVVSPVDNPDVQYISFGLQDDEPQIVYSDDTETLLFTIDNLGDCPDFLYLIDCGTPDESDPFCWPNSAQTNPGNDLAVFDFSNGNANLYYFSDIYGHYAWDCADSDGDGVVNAHEDTNGNGIFDPSEDASDLFDPNDPNGDGGIKLSLQLMADGQSWGVYANPVGGVAPSSDTKTIEGRTEIVAPIGFEIDSMVSHAGTWVHDTTVDGPPENQSRSYLGFTLAVDDPPIQYTAGQPTLLFTIYRNGDCPDQLNIIDEDNDPVVLACVPGPNDFCDFNILNVKDEGVTPIAEYYYVGNYSTSAWSCHDNDGDGILNAFEDTNGDGIFTPGIGETDLEDACDPNRPISAILTYEGATVTCADATIDNAYLMVDVEGPVSSGYTIQITDGVEDIIIFDYQIGQQIPVTPFGGAEYQLVSVMDANSCAVAADAMDGYILIAGEGPVVFNSQPAPLTACAGSSGAFAAAVSNQGDGDMRLQWEISCDDGATWMDVSNGGTAGFLGADSPQLSIINLSSSIAGCQFRLGAGTDFCETIYSDVVMLNMEGPLVIQQQPTDLAVCADADQACFEINAGNLGVGDLMYRWQLQSPSGNWIDATDGAEVSGATGTTLCLNGSMLEHDLQVRCSVQTAECSALMSNSASMSVDGPLSIISVPADQVVESFENATFNAIFNNEGAGDINYQWEVSDDGINWLEMNDQDNGVNVITGSQTASLVIAPAMGMGDRMFRLKGGTTSCGEIYTPSANLTVNGFQLTLVEDLDGGSLEVCGNDTVIFAVEYDNTEGVPAEMIWEYSNDGANWLAIGADPNYASANQIHFSVPNRYIAVLSFQSAPDFDGLIYRVRLLASNGQEIGSSPVAMSIGTPISIDTAPEDAAVCFNEEHVFSIGLPASLDAQITWMMSDDNGLSWESIDEGAATGFGGVYENVHTPYMTITSVEGLDGYLYQVLVQSGVCEAISDPVQLTVTDDPSCYPASDFVDYKLKLRPDGESWGVWIKAGDAFAPTGYNEATSGRIVIAATSGFAYYDVKSHAGGEWVSGKYMLDAPQTPGISYYTFDLTPGINSMGLYEDNEIMLFSFRKNGPCPADIYLADEFVPDGLEPNMFTATDLGLYPNVNFALGEVYAEEEAACAGSQNLIANPNNPSSGNTTIAAGIAAGKMMVFPNPATDWVEVYQNTSELMGEKTYSILSTNGAILHTVDANDIGQRMRTAELPTGMYFIVFQVDGKTLNRSKFIKK